jgi:hypothetical protein
MIQYDFIGLIVYSIGLLLWFFIWHFLVGYSLLKKMKLLYISFLGAPFVFIVNIIVSFFSPINEYSQELNLYPYVEANAKTVATLSFAIALFVVLGIKNQKLSESDPCTKLFLWLIFWAFLFSVIGTLPLYWMPPQKYWFTALRHLKSVPLFYSLSILGAAIIVFMYETGYKRKTIQEIEAKKIFD